MMIVYTCLSKSITIDRQHILVLIKLLEVAKENA